MDAFLDSTVPSDIRLETPLQLSHPGTSEQDALVQLRAVASMNKASLEVA